MIQDILRAIIQRIFRDKILMGLVIIGVLAVFMTGKEGTTEHGKKLDAGKEELELDMANAPGGPQASGQHQGQDQYQNGAKNRGQKQLHNPGQNQGQTAAAGQEGGNQPERLTPGHAADFVTWWIGNAFKYEPAEARKCHDEAFGWMTEEAKRAFEKEFWNEGMAQGIERGEVVAAFHPYAVHAHAVNPDGSVVVIMRATMVTQIRGGQEVNRNIHTDFLVTQNQEGHLRIAAVYNRPEPQVPAYQAHPVYHQAVREQNVVY
ncbi:MAG: hypothetical protein IPM23_25255 [Candidatus Melainabacteria bacterium]|nr:hypothetical protein [Candidatus Melainabacteria bacterium]